MLLQIRDYLKKEKVASSQQLSRRFGIEISALEPMLQLWQSKGIIAPLEEASRCNTCLKCRRPPVYYRFVLE